MKRGGRSTFGRSRVASRPRARGRAGPSGSSRGGGCAGGCFGSSGIAPQDNRGAAGTLRAGGRDRDASPACASFPPRSGTRSSATARRSSSGNGWPRSRTRAAWAGGSGWTPRPLVVRDDGRLVAAVPLYVKTNSEGEFVFDWGWADAAERAGIAYYPKLLVGVPFTPVTGARVLVARGRGARRVAGPRGSARRCSRSCARASSPACT